MPARVPGPFRDKLLEERPSRPRRTACFGAKPGTTCVLYAQAGGKLPAAGKSTKKAKALVLIGDGHPYKIVSMKKFEQAVTATVSPYLGSATPVVKHVKSATQMKKLIESGTYDTVIYFGHGVMNMPALDPSGGSSSKLLKENDLSTALAKSKAKTVVMLGCRAGWTGLARSISKKLKDVKVYATHSDLAVEYHQGSDQNELKLKEPIVEYQNGYQTKDGKKTKTRKREMLDPIDVSGDPLPDDDPQIAQ